MSVESISYDETKHWRPEDLPDSPNERLRYEIWDGVLQVSPSPSLDHNQVALRLTDVIRPQLPASYLCGPGVGIRIGDSYRVPDVSAFRSVQRPGAALYPADSHIALASEVVSPSSRLTDVTVKTKEYAQAGIPVYLLIDRTTNDITVYLLDDGASAYRIAGRFGTGETIEIERPFPLRIEVDKVLT